MRWLDRLSHIHRNTNQSPENDNLLAVADISGGATPGPWTHRLRRVDCRPSARSLSGRQSGSHLEIPTGLGVWRAISLWKDHRTQARRRLAGTAMRNRTSGRQAMPEEHSSQSPDLEALHDPAIPRASARGTSCMVGLTQRSLTVVRLSSLTSRRDGESSRPSRCTSASGSPARFPATCTNTNALETTTKPSAERNKGRLMTQS